MTTPVQLSRWILLPSAFICGHLGLGSSSHAADKTKAKITSEQHVLPVLKDKCVSCHNQDRKKGGLILNNYTKLMEGGSSGVAVKPGDPDNSRLYKAVAHTQEPYMPHSAPKLPQDRLELIRKWIAGGAPENAGSKVVMADKPKVDLALPVAVKGKPAGPPPMPPNTLRLEPIVRAARDTAITALAASPWAPLVAVGGQKQVLLYQSDTLELLGVLAFPEGTPHVLRFSRNGSLLLAGGGRGGKSGRVVVWSVTKGERVFEVGDESDAVLAADISPDQTRVALGGPGKVVRIYGAKDGKLLHEVRKHTEWVTALEFSPDGVLLASGDRAGGLFVWEAFTAREYFTLKGHTACITAVSWRADSNVVASCSEDTTIRLFEMENGNQVRGWGAHGGGALAVRFARDGQIASAGRDRLVRLWNGNGGNVRNFEALPDLALQVAFSHDGKRIIAGDWTGQVVVWNTADGKRIGTLSANPPTVAEQLVLAQKTRAEKQKRADPLLATAKASQAALAKGNADLAAAQKSAAGAAAVVKAAEARLNQAKTAVATAQTAQADAQADAKAKEVLSEALGKAALEVKGQADRDKTNAPLQEAATRTQTLAIAAATELDQSRKTLADLTTAARTVAATLLLAQQGHTAAVSSAAQAPKTVQALTLAVKSAQVKATADQAALAQAAAELNEARAAVAKWQAAAALAKKTSK
jgi:hypothetical protein